MANHNRAQSLQRIAVPIAIVGIVATFIYWQESIRSLPPYSSANYPTHSFSRFKGKIDGAPLVFNEQEGSPEDDSSDYVPHFRNAHDYANPSINPKSSIEDEIEANEKQYGHYYFWKLNDLHRLADTYSLDLQRREQVLMRILRMEQRIPGVHTDQDLKDLADVLKKLGKKQEFAQIEHQISNRTKESLSPDLTQISVANQKTSGLTPVSNMQIDRDTMLHPILQSWAGHGLEGIAPDSSVYQKLNNFHSYSMCDWHTYFQHAEQDAAAQFCKLVIGASKDDVERLGGKPGYRGGPAPCWNIYGPEDDVWVYRFGGTCATARLIFRNGRCQDATLCSDAEKYKFDNWQASEICRYAKGKTVAEILKQIKAPTHVADQANNEVNTMQGQESKALLFQIGQGLAVKLTITDGLCTKAELVSLVH